MALQILPKASAARNNPTAKILLDYFMTHESDLHLEDSIIFYNFPLFREDDHLLVAEFVLISPWHGLILISTAKEGRELATSRLDGAYSQIFSRLVKYPKLRVGRARLAMAFEAVIWLPDGQAAEAVKVGFTSLAQYLESFRTETRMESEVFEELLSVLDGSKALIKAKERQVIGFPAGSRVSIIAKLEEEIRKFDSDQRVAYMTEVEGPQRIRGLAGSGKTVVIALKAALTAIRNPDALIAVTFYTKSLYQHIKQLITRFYRMHEDKDPDWTKVQVLHAWGGASLPGLYSVTSQRFGHQPLNYSQALSLSRSQPFAAVCARLLDDQSIHSSYDYVFVDETQDFPPEFMRLALRLARDEKLVIAYDVFQTIFDVEIPTTELLFGSTEKDQAPIIFDEDIILHKCYRNPREILVCAHAIGFGIYGAKIAQMLESKEHWRDFGYEVDGELIANKDVVVTRSKENSPSSISDSATIDQIIAVKVFKALDEEIENVTNRIHDEIKIQGVSPEDILVICADDRNAGIYFRVIQSSLEKHGIFSNNLQDESYSLRDFQRAGAVTLATVYKAKGNEAYSVYVLGIDSLFIEPSPRTRNRVFTAMTRAKGWLYITGIGSAAKAFAAELDLAKKNCPNLKFVYPSEQQIDYMKRDLVEVDPLEVGDEISRLGANLDPNDFEKLLRKQLRDVQNRKRIKQIR